MMVIIFHWRRRHVDAISIRKKNLKGFTAHDLNGNNMSDSAEIILIGAGGEGLSTEHLLQRIESIKEWDNGHNYDIRVVALNHGWYDKIENVQAAIKSDLQEYIQNNMKLSNRMTFKTGS